MPLVLDTVPTASSSTDLCESLIRQSKRKIEIQVSSEIKLLCFQLGSPLVFGTPAYWIVQHHLNAEGRRPPRFAIGSNLYEETLACLLGGYGIPAEVGLEAFAELQRRGLTRLEPPVTEQEIFSVLSAPLKVRGRQVHYRFPQQKANRIALAARYFADHDQPVNTSFALREWLLKIPGIGPKTASWVVRNSTGSNDVAIIDIHIQRAGIKAGFFLPRWEPARHYAVMEEAFLAFARVVSIPASELDALMWIQMRTRA